jgi:exopolyphosphatase/guanosine-5'-triphosphate,3'-diphosphate pyrophosphatase
MIASPLAVIDLGSNSSRVVVLRADAAGALEVLADDHVSLRLIRGLDERRRLRAGAQDRVVRVLLDFRHVAAASGARRTVAVATAALREAANAPGFLRRVRAETGLAVRILDARTEARCAFLGAVYGLPVESGLMVDIGGGSLQIARFRNRSLVRTWGLPLGALRLSDRFLRDDPPGRGEMRRLRQHVHEALARAGIPARRAAETLVGTGGTIRNLAKVDAQRTRHPVPRLHGYDLSRRHLQEVVGLVAARRLEARGALAGLNPRRADSIVGGGLIAECVMDDLGADRLLVAGQGLREGLVLAAGGLPMPSPLAVRARSIAALAARFAAWEEGRATRRLALVRSLYRKLEPHASPELEEMLAHAALVIDVGRSVDYYHRHEHSAAILRVTGLLGFTHREILLLAAVIELAGDDRTSLKPGRPLLRADDRAPLARAACVLALADFIEHRLPPARAPLAACEVKRKSVVFHEPCLFAWQDEEFTDRFRRAFGKELYTDGRRG